MGDGFYQLSKWLPSGTHMTWGVNFGLDDVTNAVNMAKSIVKAFGTPEMKAANVYLDFLELGQSQRTSPPHCLTELQAMKQTCTKTTAYARPIGPRRSMWSSTSPSIVANPRTERFLRSWVSIAGPLVDAAPDVPFQGASFASGGAFTPTIIFNGGIFNSPPGQAIKQSVPVSLPITCMSLSVL